MLAASAPNCCLQLCRCCRCRIAPSAPKRGRFTWGGVSENTAGGSLTYQREQKVMPHPGRVQGWAHRSRVCLHDLGHVPCHLSTVWGYHQPCQVLGDRKALLQCPGWSVVRHWPQACLLEFHFPQCWWLEGDAFLCGSASGRALVSKPCQGWGSIPISWGERSCWRLSGVGALPSPCPALPREQSMGLHTDLDVGGMCR